MQFSLWIVAIAVFTIESINGSGTLILTLNTLLRFLDGETPMKIRYSLLGLAMVAIAFVSDITTSSAQPQSPESKQSQCQRFEAGMVRFNANLTARENDRNTQRELVERLIIVLKSEIQQLESQTFSDAKIQSFHQLSLNSIIAAHDNMVDYGSAVDRGDQTKADAAFGNLQLMPYQISDVLKQFEQYCGKP